MLSFARLDGEPFIRLQQGRYMASVYRNLCDMTGCTPQVVFEAASIVEAAVLCAHGMGITLVTDMLVQHSDWKEPPQFFRLQESLPKRRLVAACRRNAHISLAARAFIEMLKN